MPTTRKKVIKTVYKDDDDSEGDVGDFSDSGSEAQISEESNSEDEEEIEQATSEDEFVDKNKKKKKAKPVAIRKPISLKTLISKVHKQSHEENSDITPSISVKDLTEEDKLLPSLLNLSESDSSDDEFTTVSPKKVPVPVVPSTSSQIEIEPENEKETELEYKDVWSNNIQDNGEDIAKKTFMELQEHNTKIEETKASIQKYTTQKNEAEFDIKDLLAQGEQTLPKEPPTKKKTRTKKKVDSDSEAEDWEEVKETKTIPQQGLQLFVEFPDAARKKKKAIDVEMMMKRKLNRVKKENQVYMHKVHILCWLGHGNFISRILNDQELMSAALSLVPSKECYPGERVDLKYIEQITSWYRDKLTLKQDKNEDKFKPKALHLKNILQSQIKSRVVTAKKYMVFIFVIMLRALGLQCRVMFNFVAVPLKPPISELCSLSTKPADSTKDKKSSSKDKNKLNIKQKCSSTVNVKSKQKKVPQLDGNYDFLPTANLIQLDGSNDDLNSKQKPVRSTRANKKKINNCSNENQDMSPPKKLKRNPVKTTTIVPEKENKEALVAKLPQKTTRKLKNNTPSEESLSTDNIIVPEQENVPVKTTNLRRTRGRANQDSSEKVDKNKQAKEKQGPEVIKKQNKLKPPKITVTDENHANVASTFFEKETGKKSSNSKLRLSRKRTYSAGSNSSQAESTKNTDKSNKAAKTRTKSAPGTSVKESKYFNNKQTETSKKSKATASVVIKQEASPEQKRVSHRDLLKSKTKPKNDVTDDLIEIITNRMKQESPEAQKGSRKGRIRKSTNDPDFKPCMDSDDDFKPTKLSPKPSTSKVIDRRVLSSDEDTPSKKTDVWCEIFVEELEQWICVDLITGKIHDANFIYNRCTHPVCYIVGWDNNNYLKDLTRRYVPHWNTITRKLRAEQGWWDKAVQPWLGPKTARQREEDEFLDKMQLDAPIPKSIAEYKNHPLYALKRHLLKFEAIYPPDAATLGFVRGEPVYARECVYVCRSRDTWLKEAKVVRIGEEPYKIVKARPKWDKLSNKLITDKPLEVFGPWQVKDYEPPVAENGIVPRNAYGNVELFKDCMLPKGTVHIKLPGLNKVARKLNIDCAPAMTGFDFNGGWSHPVYDGFVVCKEYEEIITEAWVKDQEEQEKREREKTDARVYGNWRKLIKGLLIRERIKNKYGFENPTTSQANKNKAKTPRFVAKKNNK